MARWNFRPVGWYCELVPSHDTHAAVRDRYTSPRARHSNAVGIRFELRGRDSRPSHRTTYLGRATPKEPRKRGEELAELMRALAMMANVGQCIIK
jgi:hypothetical protein